jgi:UDP-N-acetylglucosamine--N-acetylmuramyl-(pentapeptide) pyrophosphoryl-undecaprenol N-acetylglucosamine transferase
MAEGAATIAVAAGGTGGHLFPAQALAEELVARGYDVQLVTDERVADYGKSFPASATHVVPSATLSLSQPLKLPIRVLTLVRGALAARKLFQSMKPKAVVGFGGYPSLTPLAAALSLGIPCCIHEQNSVLGRANRLLSSRVQKVATSFAKVYNLPTGVDAKLIVTGNPVRKLVIEQRDAAYPALGPTDPFRLLVFGGSQGARFFAEFMPQVIQHLETGKRLRLAVTQQCRPEDLETVRKVYAEAGIKAELQAFFMDMPARIAASHLVFCRSGASTIAELGVIGRPAVMVPLPHAIDNDQLKNAESFAAAGAGWVRPQASLKPAEFAEFLSGLIRSPDQLKAAAKAALTHGKPDSAKRLADLAVELSATARR